MCEIPVEVWYKKKKEKPIEYTQEKTDVSLRADFSSVYWWMHSWVYKEITIANEEKIVKTEPSIYL